MAERILVFTKEDIINKKYPEKYSKIIDLFKEGYCTPQISQIAKKLKEPSTTIHYNIKKLEKAVIKELNFLYSLEK